MKQNYIFITGGSGYIGSAIAMQFMLAGYQIIIIDRADLPEALAFAQMNNLIHFFKSDFADLITLEHIFDNYSISTVIHCAASIEVGASVKDPAEFYTNNVSKTIILLDIMRKHLINKIIFSSSCAVFGIPTEQYLRESHTKNPVSPYGKTKLMVEMILQDYAAAYGLQYVILRYFNASGAWLEYGLGERHEPETHLIPLLIKALQNNSSFTLFGDQHATKDGTCVRDYLHIKDIAHAHLLSYEYLQSNLTVREDFNIGTGNGTSILEIVESVGILSKANQIIKKCDARIGDPPYLVADYNKAQKMLGWKPIHSNIEYILNTALAFHTK